MLRSGLGTRPLPLLLAVLWVCAQTAMAQFRLQAPPRAIAGAWVSAQSDLGEASKPAL